MNLENDLRRTLRRESPPAGFAGRVMQRIERGAAGSQPAGFQRRAKSSPLHWWRAAAASVMLAAVLGGYALHENAERKRGERARDEVLRAMSIASEKVRYAQQQVRDIGSH
jgi:hypothetical protein